MYTVLSVSRDEHLLLQRNDALAMCGYRVVSPRLVEDAPLLASEKHVDALVVGESVEAQNRTSLISAIRRLRPSCVVLFVYTGSSEKREPLADVSVNGDVLIDTLREHLSRSASGE